MIYVKQDCILSLAIFSVVMEDLIDSLFKKQAGFLYKVHLRALLYAEDSVLLAISEEELKYFNRVKFDIANSRHSKQKIFLRKRNVRLIIRILYSDFM